MDKGRGKSPSVRRAGRPATRRLPHHHVRHAAPVTAPLLHLITADDWAAAQARGTLAPTHGDGFVHLSTPDQVTLPANALFAGRTDLLLLTVDPAGLDVRFEPGMPYDPPGMLFPHAYGTVPTTAVVAAVPYRPGPDGRFAAP